MTVVRTMMARFCHLPNHWNATSQESKSKVLLFLYAKLDSLATNCFFEPVYDLSDHIGEVARGT